MLGLRRFRSLVRGVSNHGAAPSFETGATRRLRFSGSTRTCALLRMRRINGQHHLDSFPAGTALVDLFNEIIKFYLRLRAFQTTRVLHDLLVGIAGAVEIDVGFSCPFRIGDEFVRLPAAKQLFRNAALLLDHQRRALLLPDLQGVFDLGWVDGDVDESYYGHGVLLSTLG